MRFGTSVVLALSLVWMSGCGRHVSPDAEARPSPEEAPGVTDGLRSDTRPSPEYFVLPHHTERLAGVDSVGLIVTYDRGSAPTSDSVRTVLEAAVRSILREGGVHVSLQKSAVPSLSVGARVKELTDGASGAIWVDATLSHRGTFTSMRRDYSARGVFEVWEGTPLGAAVSLERLDEVVVKGVERAAREFVEEWRTANP